MKKEQQVILGLLKEIDEICQKNKIDYYLSPRLTLCAVTGQPFPKNPLFGVVLMKTADMERFREAVQEEPGQGRALESMKNHKWFPGFYLRYENTDTLCINLDAGRDYAQPGLGINIQPLRTKISDKKKRRKISMNENGWLQLCDSFYGEKGARTTLAKIWTKIRALGGQAGLAAKLYDGFCESFQEADATEYVLKRRKLTTKFPAELFAKSKRVTLEGESFQVPADTDLYLKTSYGEDYMKETEPDYTQALQMVVSARVSCDTFREEAENLDELIEERIRHLRRQAKDRERREYFNECWDYAVFCGNRMNTGISYQKQKGYIRNLYKNQDYRTLEKVFKSYTKMMQKSLQREELFKMDEEIYDIYMDVLEKTGKSVQKKKIENLV